MLIPLLPFLVTIWLTALPFTIAVANYNLSTSILSPSTVTAVYSPTGSIAIVKTTTYLTVPYGNGTTTMSSGVGLGALATSTPVPSAQPGLQNAASGMGSVSELLAGICALVVMLGLAIWKNKTQQDANTTMRPNITPNEIICTHSCTPHYLSNKCHQQIPLSSRCRSSNRLSIHLHNPRGKNPDSPATTSYRSIVIQRRRMKMLVWCWTTQGFGYSGVGRADPVHVSYPCQGIDVRDLEMGFRDEGFHSWGTWYY